MKTIKIILTYFNHSSLGVLLIRYTVTYGCNYITESHPTDTDEVEIFIYLHLLLWTIYVKIKNQKYIYFISTSLSYMYCSLCSFEINKFTPIDLWTQSF